MNGKDMPSEHAGWAMFYLFLILMLIGCPLFAMLFVGFFGDPPPAKAIIPSAFTGVEVTGKCTNNPAGTYAGSSIVVACEAFQDTQLPNVFPEVPPAVATPTPAPVETPTPAPQSSTSSSSQSSQSTQHVTPPPPPPPANCVPSTLTANGTPLSGSGSSTGRTWHYTSGALGTTITFNISGLGACNPPHYNLYASAPGAGGGTDFTRNCGTPDPPDAHKTAVTKPSSVANEQWTITVTQVASCT
jgi:hypothetical protein